MADIELVIKIPKEMYAQIINENGIDTMLIPYKDIIKNGTPLPKGHNGKDDVLDKIQGYVDHIRNTGMGKKKSLEFIEKYIEGLKAERSGEVNCNQIETGCNGKEQE